MYAGFITVKHTSHWLGAHQRFNRVARRYINDHVAPGRFPSARQIMRFEGYNGPDGLKIKSPHRHEPKHFYHPERDEGHVPHYVESHYRALVIALRDKDLVKAAFEASWLAHSITDGLTPAHHFPYEEEVEKLRGHHQDGDLPRRNDKFLIRGNGKRDTAKRTIQMMGSKGILSTHLNFEIGIAATVRAMRFREGLNDGLLDHARSVGEVTFFKEQSRKVYKRELYDKFYQNGWTVRLGREVKRHLAPVIAQTIAIIWLLAAEEAGVAK